MHPKRSRWSASPLVGVVTRFVDFVTILVAGYLAFVLRSDATALGSDIYNMPSYYPLVVAAAVLFVLLPGSLYSSWRGISLLNMLTYLLIRWGVVIGLVLLWLFAFKVSYDFSRLWFGLWFMMGGVMLVAARLAIYLVLRVLRRSGFNHRHVALIGDEKSIAPLVHHIGHARWTGYEIQEVVERVTPEAVEALAMKPLDEIWLALPVSEALLVDQVLFSLRHSSASIRFVPDPLTMRLLKHGVSDIAGVTMFNLFTTPLTGTNQLLKFLEDKILAFLIVLCLSPLYCLLAIAVKFSSPGPVFFSQDRLGVGGRKIRVYKFRSMVVHQESPGQLTQARKHDARITPLGAFLRRTSLDELPQFFNVLKGDMSIVGPRPHAISHNDQYKDIVDDYMMRHLVKPGITGWAQINGYRGETDTLEKMRKRVEYDLYYIEHWSLWLDLKIIFLTVFKGFINKNAY